MPRNDKPKKIPAKPQMKWQTGGYSQQLNLDVRLPMGFLLLCKLVNVEPVQILRDFMDNLACGSWNREGRDMIKTKLQSYFIGHGYGRELYSVDDIEQIFKELDAVGLLFPKDDPQMADIYCKWREAHQQWWFEKWFHKNRRV